jgi:hypothetical protein
MIVTARHWGVVVSWSLVLTGVLAAQATPPLKENPLDDHGTVWLVLGSQGRARLESWRNFGFGNAANHDADYVLLRLLLALDLRVGTHFRVYVQGKSAVLTDRDLPGGRRPADADDLDVHQGYIELATERAPSRRLTLRAGRQELLFGRERLVSPLDWTNTRRTFDGLRGTAAYADWTIDAFFSHPVLVTKSEFNEWDQSVEFWGMHVRRASANAPAFEGYWLVLERAAATFNGSVGRERRHTLGARAAKGGVLAYDLEAAYQFGRLASAAIGAGMFSADIGYTLWRSRQGRLHAGLDFASGDTDAGGDVATFNQLFPLGHAFLGFIDVVGRQNVVAANAGFGMRPLPGLAADVTVHSFRRASAADALYNAAGAVERPAGAARSLDVGTELDVTANGHVGRHASVLVGYSRFFPGDFVRQSGAARPISFFYSSVQLIY